MPGKHDESTGMGPRAGVSRNREIEGACAIDTNALAYEGIGRLAAALMLILNRVFYAARRRFVLRHTRLALIIHVMIVPLRLGGARRRAPRRPRLIAARASRRTLAVASPSSSSTPLLLPIWNRCTSSRSRKSMGRRRSPAHGSAERDVRRLPYRRCLSP